MGLLVQQILGKTDYNWSKSSALLEEKDTSPNRL